MPVKTTYHCDLCEKQIFYVTGSGTVAWVLDSDLEWWELNDPHDGDVVVCDGCARGLADMVQRKAKRDAGPAGQGGGDAHP